jgi:pimeloyl-ACP methyl ester carboxylesterase
LGGARRPLDVRLKNVWWSMPFASSQGVKLYFEETGRGHPIVFVHELAADHRNWESQVRWFSRHYRCIAFNARGYPPSDVPESGNAYGYTFAADDIAAVLDHLGLAKAHVVGLSMGGYATLCFGMRHPARATALVVAGCGSGAPAADRVGFAHHSRLMADRFLENGAQSTARELALGPSRVQLQNKDPRGWAEFTRYLGEHSALGSALTLRNVQATRPSLFDFEADLAKLEIPVLLAVGDEDDACLDTNLFLKRVVSTAGLWVVPKTGHAINLEEPALFNQVVQDFFSAVERGRWMPRDPRSVGSGGAFAAVAASGPAADSK